MSTEMLRTEAARMALTSEVKAWGRIADPLTKAAARLHIDLRPPVTRLLKVLSKPRAPHYEAYLIEIGYPLSEARSVSIWILGSATGLSRALSVRRRKFCTAVARLSKAALDGSTRVLARRAGDLLPLLDSWTEPWIANGIAKAGLAMSFDAFRDLVQKAADRDQAACAQLRDVALLIAGHCKARGRAVKSITVAHALLLLSAEQIGHRSGSTYKDGGDEENGYKGEYDDRATAATRLQFQQPRFDPTAARRLATLLRWRIPRRRLRQPASSDAAFLGAS